MISKARQTRENSFGWILKMLSQKIDKFMVEELRPLELNLGSFAILMVLSEQEGVNQTELGKAVGVPGYSTTRTLDVLELRGLVERRSDPVSRRVHRIYLTNEGIVLSKELPAIVQRVNTNFLCALKKSESAQLIDTLKKVLQNDFKVQNKNLA